MDIGTAKYTKIGNMVTLYAFIRTDDVDVTGGSGEVRLAGLPFTISGSGGGLAIGRAIGFSTAPDGGFFVNLQSYIALRKSNASTALAVADLTDGTVANQNDLMFTATYMVS
jgi:hypothetical protein